MRKYEHLIWDWNGTLLNDIDICVEVLNELLETHTQRIYSVEEYKAAFGFPIIDYYQRVGFDFEKEPFPDLCNRFMRLYHAQLPQCNLQNEATQVLKSVRDLGVQQHVLSAAEHKSLTQRVKDFDLEVYFEHVVGLENNQAASKVENGKMLAQKIVSQPEKILFIGDTLHDKEVADAMGIKTVLLAHGHQERGRLESSGAVVLDNLMDLFLFVKG